MPLGGTGKRVLLAGDYAHRDFRDVVAWLAEHTRLACVPTVAETVARLREQTPPHVLMIAQGRPGRFNCAEIERLHTASPLSRLVALLGSWCEGEGRSGRPWPGVLRVFWHQWQARLIPELSGDVFPRFSQWSLPRTVDLAEQSAQVLAPPRRGERGLVAVCTPSLLMFRGLSDACRDGGYATVWVRPAQPPQLSGVAAWIWDGIAGDAAAADELRRLRPPGDSSPLVALLDFVRGGDRDRALAAGATAVLAKPFLIGDLLWHLDQAPAAAVPPASLPAVA